MRTSASRPKRPAEHAPKSAANKRLDAAASQRMRTSFLAATFLYAPLLGCVLWQTTTIEPRSVGTPATVTLALSQFARTSVSSVESSALLESPLEQPPEGQAESMASESALEKPSAERVEPSEPVPTLEAQASQATEMVQEKVQKQLQQKEAVPQEAPQVMPQSLPPSPPQPKVLQAEPQVKSEQKAVKAAEPVKKPKAAPLKKPEVPEPAKREMREVREVLEQRATQAAAKPSVAAEAKALHASSVPSAQASSASGSASAATKATSQPVAGAVPLMVFGEHQDPFLAAVMQTVQSSLKYPRRAQARGWQGVVTVEFSVTVAGQLDDIKIYQSSGRELLDQAAISAVTRAQAQWPQPVRAMRVRFPVRFELRG